MLNQIITFETDLFGASAPVSALKAQPMTTSEIDSHPDADRIWATIEAIRAEHEGQIQENEDAKEEGYLEGYEEGQKDGRKDLVTFADAVEIDWEVYEGHVVFGARCIEETEEDIKALEILNHKLQLLTEEMNREYEF